MTVEFRAYLGGNGELEDLREWMSGLEGVAAKAVPRPAAPNSQGSVWDFLSVACGTGGPVVAALRALQLWIDARVTVIHIEVGDSRFAVRSQDPAVLAQVASAIRALEPAPKDQDA
jgi:hypothetical protein